LTNISGKSKNATCAGGFYGQQLLDIILPF